MSYAINNLPSCITIGRETETAVTEIRIDCAEWLDRWPDMDVSVIVRTGRGAIYIPANLTMEGKTLVWCVDDVDTSILNKSTMEITGIAPDRHKLSEKVDILVDERLAGTTGETPDPMKPWVDRVIEAANTVGDARDDAVSAKDEAFDSANVAYKAAFDARESEKNAHASEQEATQSANIAKDAEENTRATLVTVNGLAEYAKSSAEMAKESEEKSLQNANNAGTYATSAKESEIIARESGETAKTSAQSAQTSAGSAAESANQAKRSEEAAKGYADNTGEYARIATEKAQKAIEQANSAGVSATSAEESANRASASEQNAATSAQEAKSSADSTKGYSESANEAAVNASDSAREAQVSAENAAASANNAEASKASAQVSAENARVSSQNAEDALQELRDKIASGEFKGEKGEPGKDAVVDTTLTQSGQAADAKVTGDVVSQLKGDVTALHNQADALFALCLDGTPATYKAVMKSFFLTNGAANATPAELTALCDRWYTATRTGWDGGVKFYAPDVSAVSDGEKIGNNAGLTCTPSTNTVAGQDDYAGLPLFACVDVNWIVDPETLEPVITAIDGITDSFDRYDPAKFVGVMQMSGYRWWNDDDADYYLRGYCDSLKPYANIEPLAEAVRASDNSVRPWVVHAKYMAKVENGKFTCYSGVTPTAPSVSHNTSHTYASAVGPQYSGGTASDNAWLKLMSMIKYGGLTQDGVNQGCVQYNYQYPAAVAESGVQRVIIPKDLAANLIVGSSVIIGNYAGSLDRGNSGMYSITGQAGAVITSIQEVTIDGNTYAAVNVDCAAFDTVANGASTTGTTYISTWHWRSGTCDNVLGNDGSPDSPGSGKYPAMIQGIEYSVGGYEVYADVILHLYKDSNDVYWYEPYLVNRSAQQSTGITSNYKATGLKCQQTDASGWRYIKKEGYAKGIYFPILVGGSSSTYHRDSFYLNAAIASTREWLAVGYLDNGVGYGGLSLLNGGLGLSGSWWGVLARLSPNGNRGEWAA